MNPNTTKQIDYLFRNSKQMVLLSILGLFVPVVLLIAAPLGLVYARQRSELLKRIDEDSLVLSDDSPPSGRSIGQKVAYLRGRPVRFWLPSLIIGAYLLLTGLLLFRGKGPVVIGFFRHLGLS